MASKCDLTADLFFVAALRAGADSGHTRLLPLALQREPLAPHGKFSQRILLALQALGYIEPELSLSHAEDWLYARDWIAYGFSNISWRVLKSSRESLGTVERWTEGVCEISHYIARLVPIWQDLALAEVAQYARWSLARSAFNPDWADEATAALEEGLRNFGASQVMYLIHIALRSIALTHQRGGVATHQLGHVFASAIANYVYRAMNEHWAIRGMTRPLEQPRSSIAIVFSETMTGLNEAYLNERPCAEALRRTIGVNHAIET